MGPYAGVVPVDVVLGLQVCHAGRNLRGHVHQLGQLHHFTLS